MKVIPRENLIIRESMLLPFRGGELWGIELDALSVHTDLVTEKFLQDIAFARRASTPSAVAIHLRDTLVTAELAAVIAQELCAAGPSIRRVALVGLRFPAKRLLRAALAGGDGCFTSAFFGDYERAKEWLIP